MIIELILFDFQNMKKSATKVIKMGKKKFKNMDFPIFLY